MNPSTAKHSKILGLGSYLPEKTVTNYDLEKTLDTSHDWIVERSGIVQRQICEEHESAASMGTAAAQKALDDAGLNADQIGMIIVATATPNRLFPSTACYISHALGCNDAAAFDVTAACAGWVYGLNLADSLIKTGAQKHILVIGTEALSKITDWTDRKTAVLFGDGAGAVVLGPSEKPGIVSSHIHANGQYIDFLYSPNLIRGQEEGAKQPKIFMQGNDVFKVAVKTLAKVAQTTLDENQLTHEDIDWMVPHQANLRIIQATGKRLKIPENKVIVTVDKHGNTSSASIPLAIDVAVKDGRIKRGDKLLLETFGGGFTWGSAIIVY